MCLVGLARIFYSDSMFLPGSWRNDKIPESVGSRREVRKIRAMDDVRQCSIAGALFKFHGYSGSCDWEEVEGVAKHIGREWGEERTHSMRKYYQDSGGFKSDLRYMARKLRQYGY